MATWDARGCPAWQDFAQRVIQELPKLKLLLAEGRVSASATKRTGKGFSYIILWLHRAS